MSYLIILFVIALALAPVLALKPSKAQKHLVKLRDCAREAGLQVQLGHLPQTHRQQVRREDPESGAAYRLLWRHEQAKISQFQFLLLRQETEVSKVPPPILQVLEAALVQLPGIIEAVEFSNLGVAVYWREKGDCDTVGEIARCLISMRDTLEPVHW